MNYLLMHIYIYYCDNLLECPIESEGQMELLWGSVYNSKASTGGTQPYACFSYSMCTVIIDCMQGSNERAPFVRGRKK